MQRGRLLRRCRIRRREPILRRLVVSPARPAAPRYVRGAQMLCPVRYVGVCLAWLVGKPCLWRGARGER